MNNDMISKLLPLLMGQNSTDLAGLLGGKDISGLMSSLGGKDLSGFLSLLNTQTTTQKSDKKNFDGFVKVSDYYKHQEDF